MRPAERAQQRRDEQSRVMNDGADRLAEVLVQYGVSTDDVDREELLGWACHVMGLENDYYEDEDAG